MDAETSRDQMFATALRIRVGGSHLSCRVLCGTARVHGTEPDMLTGSMDGFSAMFEHARPVYEGRSYKQNLWFHTDERPGAQHHTVQGTLLCC